MGKLTNLATLAALAAGAGYYLGKKGILKVVNKVDENGAREFSVKYEAPEKPLAETVKEDLKVAADTVTEKANEFVNAAKGKFEEVEEAFEEAKEEVEEKAEDISKDIDDLLKELDDKDLGL